MRDRSNTFPKCCAPMQVLYITSMLMEDQVTCAKAMSRRRKTGYKHCTIHMTNNFHLLHAIKPSKRHPVFVFALDSILFMSYSTVNSILSQLNCYVLQYFRAILKTGIHKKNVHFYQYITSLFNTFTNSYLFCIFITNKLHFAATNRLVP